MKCVYKQWGSQGIVSDKSCIFIVHEEVLLWSWLLPCFHVQLLVKVVVSIETALKYVYIESVVVAGM